MKNIVKSILAVTAFTVALAACSQKTETTEATAADTVAVDPAPVAEPDTTQTQPADTTTTVAP